MRGIAYSPKNAPTSLCFNGLDPVAASNGKKALRLDLFKSGALSVATASPASPYGACVGYAGSVTAHVPCEWQRSSRRPGR